MGNEFEYGSFGMANANDVTWKRLNCIHELKAPAPELPPSTKMSLAGSNFLSCRGSFSLGICLCLGRNAVAENSECLRVGLYVENVLEAIHINNETLWRGI